MTQNNQLHFDFIVSVEDVGSRLDLFLVRQLSEHAISRTSIQNQISSGCISVNGNFSVKAKTLLEENDQISADFPPPKQEDKIIPQAIELDKIYEDDSILVINKAPGIVVHPGEGNREGTIVHALYHHYPELFNPDIWQADPLRAGIVHRLDKDTGGILLIAKTPKIAEKLKKKFKERETNKFYYTIVHGHLPYTQGRIENYLARHPTHRQKRAVVSPDTPNAKEAISTYRVMSEVKLASLVRVNIETGRTHQIRVHMSHSRCPVVGDPLYGGRRPQIQCDALMLHAWKLAFEHPETEETMTFTAPLPKTFLEVAQHLGLTLPPEVLS